MTNREQIILLLSPRAPSPTTDVAAALGISKALAYDCLKRMERVGLVESVVRGMRTGEAGGYFDRWWKLVPL